MRRVELLIFLVISSQNASELAMGVNDGPRESQKTSVNKISNLKCYYPLASLLFSQAAAATATPGMNLISFFGREGQT